MGLELYYDLLSQPSRAVYIFMKCAGVDFKGTKVDLMKGEHTTPEFVKKNPYKKVPIIIDDGFALSESSAIMRYVALKKKVAEQWYPRTDLKKQARVDEFLHWQQFAIRKPCVDIFLENLRDKLTVGLFTQKPMDEAKVNAAKEALEGSLAHIANYFLKDSKFVGGDKVSAADILGVCELYQLHGVALLDPLVRSYKLKKVGEWVDNVIKALQPEFDKASTVVKDVRKMYDDAIKSGGAKK